jgi:polyketide synthase PksN
MFNQGEQSLQSLMDRSGLLPIYTRWLQEWIRIFASEGYLQQAQDRIIVSGERNEHINEIQQTWDKQKKIWSDNPNLRPQIVLLDKIMVDLPAILTGDKMSTEVIFPNSSLELIEAVYKNNPLAIYLNQVLVDNVVKYIKQRLERETDPAIRIFEIGAGTGATTTDVLDKLKGMHNAIKEYCYTDISNAFLNHAEESYSPGNPFLTYKIFNVETSPVQQDVDVADFDIVIAANVLHATKNIRVTLRNAKSLLKKNGLIILNEIANNSLFNHMTFGLLEGWWLYEDPEIRLPGCPGLSANTWQQLLKHEGFHSVMFPCDKSQQLEQQIIIAESDGIVRLAQEKKKDSSDQSSIENTNVTEINTQRTKQVGADCIEVLIIEELEISLRIDKQHIDVDEPLSNYGLDSILAVNLTRVINEKLNIDMDITVMFEYATVGQLSDFIISNYREELTDILEKEPNTSATNTKKGTHQQISESNVTVPQDNETSEVQAGPVSADFSDDVAIIGINGKFPGASDTDKFWSLLEEGRSCITRVPLEREDWKPYNNMTLSETFNIKDKWGAFLDSVYEFDPLFFGIAPAEAAQMSPEQRLMLMCVWNAIEDAGYTPKTLSQKSTGVFIATGPSEYQSIQVYPKFVDNPNLLNNPSLSMMPNRISFHLNLQGPSEFCDTTCSSSIVALHRAVQSIQRNECAQAIVGGVNLILSPMGFLSMESVDMLSSNGKVCPFQEDTEGTVRSEGIGAILVKPLYKAVADNDHIYAVVKGTGIAHGGKGVSLTAPNIQGMKVAIQNAYQNSGIDPRTVSYIEAHGMSSNLADNAEIGALKSSLKTLSASQTNSTASNSMATYISSLKPCIGHAEIASGMAALFKVILAMQHKMIPAIPNFTRLSKELSLEGSPLKIAVENMPWDLMLDEDGNTIPRRASINSFGIGGINAHVVLEEPSGSKQQPCEPSTTAQSQIIVLSAKTEERLRARIKQLLEFMHASPILELANVAYTLQFGREAMEYRFSVVVDSFDELIKCLETVLQSDLTTQLGFSNQYFWGGIAERKSEIAERYSGHTGEILINNLLSENKLLEIAKDWVQGASIDWTLIKHGKTVKKVSLPGYPFLSISCCNIPTSETHITEARAQLQITNPITEVSKVCKKDSGSAAFAISIVSSVLGLNREEIHDTLPLEYYGLNSLLLIQLLSKIREVYPDYQSSWLRTKDSIQDIVQRLFDFESAKLIPGVHVASTPIFPELLHMNAITQGRPVFWLHGALGSVETFQPIASRCERPFYAIQARGFMTDHSPIEGISTMAKYYIGIIKTIQSEGPYDIGGFCLGGVISYEITRQLQQQCETVNSIVMIDSPDNTGFNSATNLVNIPKKNAALQVVNMLLWPTNEKDMNKITENMIHEEELDKSLDDGAFINQLADLALKRGLMMSHDRIVNFIKQNADVQIAYRLSDYTIQPLTNPSGVNCYYFRNRGGLFFGNLDSYFQLSGESFLLDHVNYWQDWQRELTNFNMIDIEAPNHMTILSDGLSICTISDACEKLYSTEELKV